MNNSKIDQLLSKYWKVETTLEEEKFLKAYFSSTELDDAHQELAPLFQFYQQESTIESAKNLELTTEMLTKRNISVLGINSSSLVKYAAVLVCLVGIFFLTRHQMDQTEYDSLYAGKFTTLDDEAEVQEAYTITMDALSFLSNKINRTESEIQKNMIPVTKAIEIIY